MQLRDYQLKVLEQAKPIIDRYNLVYLALDTRLGKTFISLFLASEYGVNVLFITRKKVLKSIEKDYKLSGLNLNLKIVSMDSLHLITQSEIMAVDVIIIDEAHNFGMYPKPSLRTLNLRKITEGKKCILLSATPCPESWSQIFHQLWGCNFKDLFITGYKNFYGWAREYVKMIDVEYVFYDNEGNKQIVVKREFPKKHVNTGFATNDYSIALMDKIKPKIDPYLISMTQSEAGFAFTEFDEQIINCEMPEGLRGLYDKLLKDQYVKLTIKGIEYEIIADTSAMLMSKLHQLCGGSVINSNGDVIKLSYYKMNKLDKILETNKKVAVFYKFIGEYELIQSYADYKGIPITTDWQEFNAMESGIFLSQFLSGREGINLETANCLVFYNIDHAYLSYYQTKNRIQKIDREHRPKLIWLFTKDGLEQRIYKSVCKKKNYTTKMFERAYLK